MFTRDLGPNLYLSVFLDTTFMNRACLCEHCFRRSQGVFVFSCVGIVTVISVWLVYCVCSSHRDPSLLSDCRYDSETADVSRIELHTETPCSRIPLSRPCEESRLCDEKRFLFLVLVCVWFDFPQGKWLKRLVTCQLVTEQLSASWSLTLKASTRREPFQAFSILAC